MTRLRTRSKQQICWFYFISMLSLNVFTYKASWRIKVLA